MKFDFKSLGERIRLFFSGLLMKAQGRTHGLAAMPGESNTVAGGKFKMPLIDWDKLYRKSFVYNSVAAVICGYFVADLLVASLTPWFPPIEAPRPRLNISGERHDFLAYSNAIMPAGRPNLFNEKGLVPNNDEGGGPGDAPVKTSLPLNLLGVIILNDLKKSVASVEDKTANNVVAVRLGEPITHDTIVQEITDERVTFMNNATGRREFIELPKDQILATRRAAPVKGAPAGGIQKTDDTHYHIDRGEVDKAMTNLNSILTDARCVPEMEGGKPSGYRCFQITPGSVYDKLGLKDNDVICGLNGESISDPAKAFQVLGALKDPSTRNIQICIKRNGQISNYNYDIN
jgi:type II secretion system protein C